MNNALGMKYACLAVLILFSASIAFSQEAERRDLEAKSRRDQDLAGNRTVDSAGWKTVVIEKWGVVSVSLPDSLTGEPERIEIHKGVPPKGVNSTSYSRSWNSPPEQGSLFPAVRVFLLVVSREADFRKAWGAEPDFLLSLEDKDHQAEKAKHGIADDEVGYLELNGLRGSFYKIQNSFVQDDVRVGWSTYRYHMKKAQSVSISINGPRNDLPKMMKILHSLKLR